MSQNDIKREADDNCPPGMTYDKDAGKCMEAGGSSNDEMETNAGMHSDKGTPTLESPAPEEVPATNHECPEGTSWSADKGICEPTGDDAGKVGGAGTGAPEVPGKEFAKLLEHVDKSNASHTAYQSKMLEKFANISKENLESILNRMGLPSYSKESAPFGNVKRESLSTETDQSGFGSVYKESVENPAQFMGAWAETHRGKSLNEMFSAGIVSWTVKPQAYFDSLQKGHINHAMPNQSHIPVSDGVGKEGFTIGATDPPQIFSKLVYLIPGGKMKVPIRQFLDTQIIESANAYNWYTVDGAEFEQTDDGTALSGAGDTDQTITKIPAIPLTWRSSQSVIYSDIENMPFDLIEAYNRAIALAALDTESTVILDTLMETLPTNGEAVNTVGGYGWVNGNTGALITTDDAATVTTMTQEGLYAAKRQIDVKGGDSSPGNLVFFAHPKAIEELVLDTANDFFTGSPPVGAPLHSTALGILENRLGVDIVMNNRVHATTGATNQDTYRNILMVKGIVGLAVAADVQIEAQRRPDLAAVNIGARMRIQGAIIDDSMIVRISTAQ